MLRHSFHTFGLQCNHLSGRCQTGSLNLDTLSIQKTYAKTCQNTWEKHRKFIQHFAQNGQFYFLILQIVPNNAYEYSHLSQLDYLHALN